MVSNSILISKCMGYPSEMTMAWETLPTRFPLRLTFHRASLQNQRISCLETLLTWQKLNQQKPFLEDPVACEPGFFFFFFYNFLVANLFPFSFFHFLSFISLNIFHSSNIDIFFTSLLTHILCYLFDIGIMYIPCGENGKINSFGLGWFFEIWFSVSLFLSLRLMEILFLL